MTDVILIVTIVVFFLAAALLVSALGRVVAAPAADAAPADDAGTDVAPEDSVAGQAVEPGRPA